MTVSTWSVGEDVGWVSDDLTAAVYVALLPLEPPLVLDDTARVIWLAAVDGGTLRDIVTAVCAATGVEADVVQADTAAFLDTLVSRRLLVRHDA